MNFQMLAHLADGKLGIVDTTCPLCSHDRRRPNQNKKVLRLWCDIHIITFCCVHCGAKGYVLDDDRHKLTRPTVTVFVNDALRLKGIGPKTAASDPR